MKALYKPAILAFMLVTLVACKREAPAARTTSADQSASQTANAVDATAVVDNTAALGAPTLDAKALAGKFGDGESVLELRADGTYLQTLWVAGNEITADGSWSAQGDAGLLLDPNTKSADDATFEIASNDELRSSEGRQTFRRLAAP